MMDRLHYISQADLKGSHLTAIKDVLEAGCKCVQLRIKDRSKQEILEEAVEAVSLCHTYGAKLFVNDYPDISVASGADGLHLGLTDMPVEEARALVGENMIIGGTANTFEHIVQRTSEGVDYVGLGPYRFTSTKENLSPVLGVSGYLNILQKCAERGISLPIIAIGGIQAEDILEMMQTGIFGVAISGAITSAKDKIGQVKKIQELLQRGAETSS